MAMTHLLVTFYIGLYFKDSRFEKFLTYFTFANVIHVILNDYQIKDDWTDRKGQDVKQIHTYVDMLSLPLPLPPCVPPSFHLARPLCVCLSLMIVPANG